MQRLYVRTYKFFYTKSHIKDDKMIFFDGYQQQYRVEELSSQQAIGLLTKQLIEHEETKESAHEIIIRADEMINRSYSYRTNLEKR